MKLSPRETEVLAHLAKGMTARAAADCLFVSKSTVDWHLRRIYKTLGAKNCSLACLTAIRLNLIPNPEAI